MLRQWCAFIGTIVVSLMVAGSAMAFQQTPVPVAPLQAVSPSSAPSAGGQTGTNGNKAGLVAPGSDADQDTDKSNSWFSGLPTLNFGLEVLYGDDHLSESYAPEDIAPADEGGNFSIKGTVKKKF